MENGFYSTFQAFLNIDDPENEMEPVDDAALALHMLDAEKSKPTALTELKEKIEVVLPALKRAIAKPQRLIENNPDWYIAQDLKTNTFYICYRVLLMVDIDFYKNTDKISITDSDYNSKTAVRQLQLIDQIEDYALLNDLRFQLFRTRNGIHAFLVSRPADYSNYSDLKIMADLGCDFFYIAYSRIRGWSVRVNRKEKEEKIEYRYLGDVGDIPANDYLCRLVALHINLLSVFANDGPSLMYGM